MAYWWVSKNQTHRQERDMFNGFILGPAYDAAFDAGLISFADDGSILISPMISASQLAAVGGTYSAKVRTLADAHRSNLAHHRQSVFVTN